MLAGLARDFRFAVRGLARTPAVSLLVILSLGVGIAAGTVVFGVLDAVVLKPLPYADPDRLAMVWETNHAKGLAHEPISPVNFVDYRSLRQVFSDATAWWEPVANLADAGLEPARVATIEASANFFEVLGVKPALGAGFPHAPASRDSALHRYRAQEIVISDRLWRSRYNADPGIIGRTVRLNDIQTTVTGVMPRAFHFPGDTDVWQLLNWELSHHNRAAHFMSSVVRLAPGVTVEQAEVELAALGRRLAREFPGTNGGWSARVVPLGHEVAGFFRPALFVVFAAVGLLVLVACLNVANLLVARAVGRDRDTAVRAALGASRGRLAREFLAESMTFALTGCALGVALAWTCLRALVASAPLDMPRLADAGVHLPVLGFSVLLGLGVAIVSGLGPALVMSATDPQASLRDGGRQATPGRRGRVLRGVLVAGEVALAVTLLVGAGLLVRSFVRLAQENSGFEAGPAITVSLQLPNSGPYTWPQVAPFYASLAAGIGTHREVTAVGFANFLPFSPGWRLPVRIRELPPIQDVEDPKAQFHSVSEGFFGALGVRLVRGRVFDGSERPEGPGVALINQAMARRYWGDRDPIGHTIAAPARQIGPMGQAQLRDLEYRVIGIVGDVRNTSLRDPAEPAVYCSLRQFPFRNVFLVARGNVAPGRLADIARAELRRLDLSLPAGAIDTLDGLVSRYEERGRALMTVMAVFAVFALLIAALGIYGVLAWTVGRRQQEISIRVALGAGRARIGWLVLRQALGLAGTGVAAGAVGAWSLGRALASFLFGVQPSDGITLATVALTVFVVAVAASLVPARRALRLNVVEGLK